MSKKIDDLSAQVAFDVYQVTARQMNVFFAAAAENNLEGLAEIFAAVLTKAPEDWGNCNDMNDLMDNVPYPYFRRLVDLFVEAMNAERKN